MSLVTADGEQRIDHIAISNAFLEGATLVIQEGELDKGVSDVSDIVSGKETGMITDFMEPYLKFSITRVEGLCALQIRCTYSTEDDCWEELDVSQGLSLEKLEGILAQLEMLDGVLRVLAGIIPVALIGIMLYVCKQRIEEIRSGEEDDLSQY